MGAIYTDASSYGRDGAGSIVIVSSYRRENDEDLTVLFISPIFQIQEYNLWTTAGFM